MSDSVFLDYGFLKNKIERRESEILGDTDLRDLREEPFKYLMMILDKQYFQLSTPYTQAAYIYPNYPIDLDSLNKLHSDLEFDFDQIYKSINRLDKVTSLVSADTGQRYYYKGTKFLSPVFQEHFLKAKYGRQILIFDNLQNTEKNKLDESFFVERNLGFLTKSISSMEYYEPEVEIQSTVLKVVEPGAGFYPDATDERFEVLCKLPSPALINMMYLDWEFPGEQYLDQIEYILFSLDGVNYVSISSELLEYINASFGTIYDQNFFEGLVPLHPTFARYVRIGVKQKLTSPRTVLNKTFLLAAVFDQSYESAELTVLHQVPYLASGTTELQTYKPWLFNYMKDTLIFETGGEIKFKLEASFDSVAYQTSLTTLKGDELNFVKMFNAYSSPILFNYSIFLGL